MGMVDGAFFYCFCIILNLAGCLVDVKFLKRLKDCKEFDRQKNQCEGF